MQHVPNFSIDCAVVIPNIYLQENKPKVNIEASYGMCVTARTCSGGQRVGGCILEANRVYIDSVQEIYSEKGRGLIFGGGGIIAR